MIYTLAVRGTPIDTQTMGVPLMGGPILVNCKLCNNLLMKTRHYKWNCCNFSCHVGINIHRGGTLSVFVSRENKTNLKISCASIISISIKVCTLQVNFHWWIIVWFSIIKSWSPSSEPLCIISDSFPTFYVLLEIFMSHLTKSTVNANNRTSIPFLCTHISP